MDDKTLVVICASLIVLVALFQLQATDAVGIAQSGLTGLFGVAVGKALQ